MKKFHLNFINQLPFIMLIINLEAMDQWSCLNSDSSSNELELLVNAAEQATTMNDQRVTAVLQRENPSDQKKIVKLLKKPHTLYKPSSAGVFSPNGQYFADSSSIVDAFSGKLIKTYNPSGRVSQLLSWSPGSSYIYTDPQHSEYEISFEYFTLTLYPINSDDPITFNERNCEGRGSDVRNNYITFSPHDKFYSIAGKKIINSKTGEQIKPNFEWDWCLFSPQEDFVLLRPTPGFSQGVRKLVLFCLQTKKNIRKISPFGRAAYSPDGSYLLLANKNNNKFNIYVYNVKTHVFQKIAHDFNPNFYANVILRVHPDGNKINILYADWISLIGEITTGKMNVVQRPTHSKNPPPWDWEVQDPFYRKYGEPEINYSPGQTCAVAPYEDGIVVFNKDGQEYQIPLSRKDSAQSAQIKIHPSDALIMMSKPNGTTEIQDFLVFQNLSLKELLAYRVVMQAIKNKQLVCENARTVLQQSTNNFLQLLAQRYKPAEPPQKTLCSIVEPPQRPVSQYK